MMERDYKNETERERGCTELQEGDFMPGEEATRATSILAETKTSFTRCLPDQSVNETASAFGDFIGGLIAECVQHQVQRVESRSVRKFVDDMSIEFL